MLAPQVAQNEPEAQALDADDASSAEDHDEMETEALLAAQLYGTKEIQIDCRCGCMEDMSCKLIASPHKP
jgi:hypothetical protein